jgi:hypothetical protein
MSGGYWIALQAFAWARMTMEFSQYEKLGTALAKTLSGKHPCKLCLEVQQGMQHERQQSNKMPWVNAEKLPEAIWQVRCLTVPPVPITPMLELCFPPAFCSDFIDSPPTPPPRA